MQQPCWPPSFWLRFLRRLLNDGVEVDIVLQALVFHDPRFGRPSQSSRIWGKGSGQYTWIVDDNLIYQSISLKPVALDNVILIACHLHVSRPPDLAVEIGDVDDQGVALPVTDGLSVL